MKLGLIKISGLTWMLLAGVSATAAEAADREKVEVTAGAVVQGGVGVIKQDLERAYALAAQQGKDVMLWFTGSDWCHPCQILEERVFKNEGYLKELGEKFVIVQLDMPKKAKLEAAIMERNQLLKKRLHLQGLPAVVLCDSKGRPYLEESTDNRDPKKLVGLWLKDIDKREQRDERFEEAISAEGGVEQAHGILQGLALVPSRYVDEFYGDFLQKVKELDPQDVNGYFKQRQQQQDAKIKAELKQKQMAEFFVGEIRPRLVKHAVDDAIQKELEYFRTHEGYTEEQQVNEIFCSWAQVAMEQKDPVIVDEMIAAIEKHFPKSPMLANAAGLKEALRLQMR